MQILFHKDKTNWGIKFVPTRRPAMFEGRGRGWCLGLGGGGISLYGEVQGPCVLGPNIVKKIVPLFLEVWVEVEQS